MALGLTGRIGVVCLALALAGCANPPIRANKVLCMVVGAGLLGGGAYVIENQDSHDHDDHRKEAGAAGAAVGAALGYLMCGEPAAPAPAPAAAPAPAPAPPPPSTARRIILRGVNFDFDKSEIRPDAAVILDEAASILNENPGVRVEVAGHTDATGPDDYNQGLSERRAQSVLDYLAGKGVSAGRLDAAGYGESKPVADNDTRDGRAQNRRVELNVR